MKIKFVIFVLAFSLFASSCKSENQSVVLPTPKTSQTVEIKPIFNAVALIRKSPKEVSKILGTPSESWVSGYDKNQWQSYSFGEETTIEFNKNRIKSLVIFFDKKNIDSETAYRLVGLDFGKSKPTGISDVTTGEDWIKIIYLH